MTAIQYPKWKSFTLPSRDEIHIFRDPPKSIHTRKKERIELGDVLYNLRDDESRLQEYINVYARGINPSVEVNYTNNSPMTTTTMNMTQTRNPYAVNEAFRPPIFRMEDLQPLSRLRRPYTYGITNPGVRDSFVNCGFEESVDKQTIASATSVIKLGQYVPNIIRPTAVYKIAFPVEVDGKYAIKEEVINPPISSACSSDFLNYDGVRDLNEKMKLKVINDDSLKYSFLSSLSSNKDLPGNRDLSTLKIRDDNINTTTTSNPSYNIDTKPEIQGDYKAIKDETINLSYSTPIINLGLDPNNKDLSGIKVREDAMIAPSSTSPYIQKFTNDYNPEYEFYRNSPLDKISTNVSGDKIIINHKEIDKTKGKIIPLSHGTNPKIYYENPSDEFRKEWKITGKKENKKYSEMSNFGVKSNFDGHDVQPIKLKVRKLSSK